MDLNGQFGPAADTHPKHHGHCDRTTTCLHRGVIKVIHTHKGFLFPHCVLFLPGNKDRRAVCTLFPLCCCCCCSCSVDWTVFGQLPAWHHPLPAPFTGCWPTVVQVYSDHSTQTGGGSGSGGWLRGYWWAVWVT